MLSETTLSRLAPYSFFIGSSALYRPTETGSDTAATAAVINASNDHVNTNDVIRVDLDAVQTTAAKGLIVTLGFQLP